MKNTKFFSLENIYFFSLTILFVLYLFPGSLVGYLFYGDLGQQPNFIGNPIGTSINHLFFFMFISFLGLVIRKKKKFFLNSFLFLLLISILLEFSHLLIPNRAFEYYDLSANIIGVFFGLCLCKIYSWLKNL